jgi:hypothetical protein
MARIGQLKFVVLALLLILGSYPVHVFGQEFNNIEIIVFQSPL